MAITIENYVPASDYSGIGVGSAFKKHISSVVDSSVAIPTIAITTQAGITVASLGTNSTDTRGTITLTGTSTGGTILAVTFGTPYPVAPMVQVQAANAAGGGVNTDPIPTVSTTGFTLTIPSSGVYAANPTYFYLVIG